MNLSQHLFLLCGLPFSGKSTMGRALAEEFGLIHVEVDRHRSDRAGSFGERRVERAEWISAYRAAYEQAEEAFAFGKSVVFDAVSYRRLQRERIRRIATKHGIPMTIIYLDVEPDLAKERLTNNLVNPTRPNVPEADFDEISVGMQPPMSDESWISYNPIESLDVWIRREIAPMVAP